MQDHTYSNVMNDTAEQIDFTRARAKRCANAFARLRGDCRSAVSFMYSCALIVSQYLGVYIRKQAMFSPPCE